MLLQLGCILGGGRWCRGTGQACTRIPNTLSLLFDACLRLFIIKTELAFTLLVPWAVLRGASYGAIGNLRQISFIYIERVVLGRFIHV